MAQSHIERELILLKLQVGRLRLKLLENLAHEAEIIQHMAQQQDQDFWPDDSHSRELDREIESLKARLSRLEASHG